MSCATLETILKSCDNNSGGIYRFWVNQQVNIDVDSAFTFLAPPLDYTISGIPLIAPPVLFTELEFKRNVSSYTEESNIDLINGSSFVTQTINLMFHRRNQTYSQAIKILGSGQQYLAGIVEDANGKYWYFPYLQVSATGEGSGTARADGSKYSVTLIAENDALAYEIDPAEIPNVVA
jgi:hypothetical protein